MVIAVNSKVLFEFLIDPFHLSICFRVVGCRHGTLDSHALEEVLREFGRKLRPSVRDDLLRCSVESEDVSYEKIGGLLEGDSCHAWHKVCHLRKSVCKHADRVIFLGFGQFDDEVDSEDRPWLRQCLVWL